MAMTLEEIKFNLQKDTERFNRSGLRPQVGADTTLSSPTSPTPGMGTPEVPEAQRTVYCRFNVFNLHDVEVNKATVKGVLYYELAWELVVEDQVTCKKLDG
eukprot:CAMPEP_0206318858 /NCGR_PEP_ID=MMETSP0106_2-20121207/17430_1 /ASSEMBLY_ACC=CAM_ASM_000206 /TAXON_ID=81532 /ORGANISM="Acanthoeca-like sp., Strain 10tr" /LENGTH=100 /DNA_ID=CAMNT_0053750619 /DNA_START=1 /DNA_END=299 /DNA_ORIENTATION=-